MGDDQDRHLKVKTTDIHSMPSGVPKHPWTGGHSLKGSAQKPTSDWFTSSSDHFCHRGHLSLSSKVVSLEVQQHCSWLYQNADRQTPSFKSVIQSTARSMTPAKVPGRSSKNLVEDSPGDDAECTASGQCRSTAARGTTRRGGGPATTAAHTFTVKSPVPFWHAQGSAPPVTYEGQ